MTDVNEKVVTMPSAPPSATPSPTASEAALIAAIEAGALTLEQVKAVADACASFIAGQRTAFDAVQATEPPKLPMAPASIETEKSAASKGLAASDPLVTRRVKPPIE